MSSDTGSQSKSNETDEIDDVTLMWRRLTKGYKFEDGLNHDTLTETFDIDDEDVAQAVCSEAFSYVMDDGRTRFELGDFEQAGEAVRSEPEGDDHEGEEDAVDEGREKNIEVDTGGEQITTTADGAGTIAQDSSDVERGADETHDDQEAVETIEVPREEFERLQERVAELEAQIDPDPTGKTYDAMSRDERVRKIRETLLEDAQRRHSGKAQMTYKEILRLFDNHPSDGYAYKLMTLAGQQEGFEYTDSNGTGKVIRMNSSAVNDETLVHTVNNRSSQEAA